MWDHPFTNPVHDARRNSTADHCHSVKFIEPLDHMFPSPEPEMWNSVFSFGDTAQMYELGAPDPDSSTGEYAAVDEAPVVANDCYGLMRQDIWGSVFSEVLSFST
jgi:hypothetical protein